MPQRSAVGSDLAVLSEVPGTELKQLKVSFESFREFVARYSPWLSDSCIFVETQELLPIGAPVRLEIWLRERWLTIKALGQVDWVRTESEEGTPGVALDVTYLDPASARLIDSIFRLYAGQQSAAIGKDVVETWEFDVESLIDQAFPGGGVPPGGVAPNETSQGAKPSTSEPAADAETEAADDNRPDRQESAESPSLPTSSEEAEFVEVPVASAELESAASLPIEPGAPPEAEVSAVDPAPSSPSDDMVESGSDDTTEPEVVATEAAVGEEGVDEAAGAEPADEEEWEARLSAAFSEFDTDEEPGSKIEVPSSMAEAAMPGATDVGGASSSGASSSGASPASVGTSDFGFGLVEDSSVATHEVAEEALPSLSEETSSFASESFASASFASAAQASPEVESSPPGTPSSSFIDATAAAATASGPVEAAPPDDPVAESEPASSIAPSVAGAASAVDASDDASFLRRSMLVFLVAVILGGLAFLWFRAQPTAPGDGTQIAISEPSSPAESSTTAPPTVAPPAVDPPAVASTTDGATTEPSATEASEPTPTEAQSSGGDPSDGDSTEETQPPAVASAPPAVDTTPTPTAEAPPGATTQTTVNDSPAAEIAGETQDPAEATEEIERLLLSWAAAWSQQEPQAYIDSYAPNYSPSGLSHQEWRNQRIARIQAPASILVKARDISVEILDASQARATFYQDYKTDTKHLFTWKTMELSRRPEGWRIISERVGR